MLGIFTRILLVAVAAVAFVGGAAGARHAGPGHARSSASTRSAIRRAPRSARTCCRARPRPAPSSGCRGANGATLFKAPIGASLGSWSDAYPYVYPLDFDSVGAPGTDSISVAGPVPATLADLPRRHRLEGLRGRARQRAVLLPGRARRAELHPVGAPHRAGAPERRARDDVQDAGRERRRRLRRRPVAARSPDRRVGRLVGRGRLSEVRRDDELHRRPDAARTRATSRLAARRRTSPPRRAFGTDFLLRMWDDQRRTLYYQVGIGEGNDTIAGDHDIWRLPQADDTLRRTRSALPLHPQPARLPRRTARLARQPEPRRPRRRRVRPLLPGLPRQRPGLCAQVSARRRAHLRPRRHVAERRPDDGVPVRLLSRDGVARRPRARRDGARATRCSAGDAPPGLPHDDAGYYLRKAAHWANAYITGPNDAADTLNLYDVSRPRALRALPRARAARTIRAGLDGDARRRCSPTCSKQLDGAVAQAATDPFGFGFPWAAWDTTSHGAGLVGDGERVRRADGDGRVRRLERRAGSATSSARTRGASR